MEHNKMFHTNLMLITIVNQLEKVYFSGRISLACLTRRQTKLTSKTPVQNNEKMRYLKWFHLFAAVCSLNTYVFISLCL